MCEWFWQKIFEAFSARFKFPTCPAMSLQDYADSLYNLINVEGYGPEKLKLTSALIISFEIKIVAFRKMEIQWGSE